MDGTYSIKTWQKIVSVFLSVLLATSLWGGATPEIAQAVTGETGSNLTYDQATGVFNNHALMVTKTTTQGIQNNAAIVDANGSKTITSEKHSGPGTGTNSSAQIAGILGDGNAVSMTSTSGNFGVYSLSGKVLVPIEYVAVAFDSVNNRYYGVKSASRKITVDTYNASGTRINSSEGGEGTPNAIAVLPGYIQVNAQVTNPDTQMGGMVNGSNVFAITTSGLKYESDIVTASANDDSGTAFIKTNGTVWYRPSGGSAKQIATGANTSARIEFLQADYSKIAYPKGNGVAYVTSEGAESSEGIISAMADRILAPRGTYAQLGYANDKLIANLNGEQFLWEGKVIVGFTPENSQGACQFWIYSAENGKLLKGPIQSASQVSLERQDGNYAVTYTPVNGPQAYAGYFYDANLRLISSNSAPSALGGRLPDGRTIQVAEGTNGSYKFYQVTDVYGNSINCGNYTLALGYLEGIETEGVEDAKPRVQHGNTDLYCAIDGEGNFGAVNAAGDVYVPFIYDNYYDLGFLSAGSSLNKSDYIMVHRNGQWFFYDVAKAKEVTYPYEEATQSRISIDKAKVVVKSMTYTGKRLYPRDIKVWVNGKKLVRNRDYKVSYRRGVNVGRYRLTIQGIGRYRDTYRTYYHIVPRTTRFTHFYRYHRAFRVDWHRYNSWHRYNREMTGYQIRYSWDRHFHRDVHYRYFNRNHRPYYTFRNLKSNKRYYVQIRPYRYYQGKRYYAAWSKSRYVRTA